jgi:hypothetical protein
MHVAMTDGFLFFSPTQYEIYRLQYVNSWNHPFHVYIMQTSIKTLCAVTQQISQHRAGYHLLLYAIIITNTCNGVTKPLFRS